MLPHRAAALGVAVMLLLVGASLPQTCPAAGGIEPPPKAKPDAPDKGPVLPRGAVRHLGTGRLRHLDVGQVVFSPDSKKLYSIGWDWTVRIWDVSTGRELCRSGIENGAGMGHPALALSRDGKLLACTGDVETHLL